ncbi:YbjQ family protein [Dactylosporangium sp. CA-139066]|uniref:YbjQ family protein n=1 Tax=Dactylosporangium sp. CA-139066 TaxID=3239930 RepID=UPI003D8F7F45
MLVVTTEGLPGFEITAVLGEVLGVVATSRNPFAAGIRSTEGGPGQDLSQFLVQTRSRAVGQMVQAAENRGANAIVGMRFDHRDVTNTWVELCAYGTAVVAVPIHARTGAHAAA